MVLDASGALEFLLNTARGRRLASRLADGAEVVHAPHLIDIEIAHVLRRYVLDGTLDERRALLALQQWRQLDVARYPHEPFLDRVWGLRKNVTAYDAIYVALAETLGERLVTGDRRLAGSPRLHVRVELI
ncbi:MAG: type II toxin-antitoxin system VapC family toxin [Acidobacteria bacterium]|nr:type II toxin-antitoxin system VapC family toxin [Acidobacteriota bacterium]